MKQSPVASRLEREEHPHPIADASALTPLPDLAFYRLDAQPAVMVDAPSPADWPDALEALARIYPEASRAHLAGTVFAAYFARVAEGDEPALALAFGTRPAGAFGVSLGADDVFAGLLTRVIQEDLLRTVSRAAPAVPHTVPVSLTIAADSANAAETGAARPIADLHVHCDKGGQLRIRHAANIRPEAAILVGERLATLARGIGASPATPLARQPLLSARERKFVLHTCNDTARNYAFDGGLVAMMERVAAATPDHAALVYRGETLTYADFEQRVNRLANLLRDRGVGPDRFVALCMERSLEMVIALWAVLKAGGAYVPLSPDDPAGRIAEIVADCRPVVVLTQDALADRLSSLDTAILSLPVGGDVVPDGDASAPTSAPAFHDLAYMIYTSGSTGKPKGVVVEHGAIHNRIVWMHDRYGLTPNDRVLQKTPYTFDVSVWEFLWPFAVGATLVVPEPGGHMAMGYLAQLIRQERVTHLHFVPSVLRLFLMLPRLDDLPIKKLFCSGEALGVDAVKTFYAKASARAELHNLYGPTEAAVDVSAHACRRDVAEAAIPIGRPVANTGLYILDAENQPVPVGVPGELHIGGVQLARGYWGREELTRERFIDNPVPGTAHPRLYRTGDLACLRPDGEILYLGRNDFQVKINGVRIELGEIEAAIRDQAGVRDVVVLTEAAAGNNSLVAYVVSGEPGPAMAETIKAAVAASCPAFYVPREVRFLSAMPLTASGKVDRKALAREAPVEAA